MLDDPLTERPHRPPTAIGVMGSAGGDLLPSSISKSYDLGRAIARRGFVLINGACPGLPMHAAHGAKDEGGMTVGISPALSIDEHVAKYAAPTEWLDVIIYTGSGLMGREATNIRSSDIVVFAGGRSGTLGEFAIAYEEGKLIGVLEGTGGISAEIPELVEICRKESGAHVLYDTDPDRLVERLWSFYCERHFRQPSLS
ncbi:MAG TPA: hypothetical protein V6D05_14525 [Stenomitos sp.]